MTSPPAHHRVPDGIEVARNPWAVIVRYEQWQAVELRWLPGPMSGPAFKETLEVVAGMGEQSPSQFMIIDATEFRHEFGEGVMQWRDAAIIPRYNAAGVRKFAFLVADGFPGTVESGGKPRVEGAATFPTA